MSRKSRKRMKFAALALGLMGANKLGMLGKASGVTGDKMASARKLMSSDKAMRGSSALGKVGPRAVNVMKKKATGTVGSQPFSMFGVKSMPSKSNLEKFRAANERMRLRKFGTATKKVSNSSAPGFFGLKFDKPLFSKGKMIKARGGGMARTKPTKMY